MGRFTSKNNKDKAHRQSSRLSAEPIMLLERRIAFDAAAVATLAATRTIADKVTNAQVANLLGAARNMASGSASIPVLSAVDASRASSPAANEIVFIDGGVADIKTLVADISSQLPAHAEIVLLDSTKNGVDQIAQVLAAHQGVSLVQIVSHGSAGNLYLGTADLNVGSMTTTYAADMATIKASLAAHAQVLVYGCDFAQGTAGIDAARTFAQLTGAEIAASTNLTGAASFGADWTLEFHTGTMPVTASFDARTMANWNHDLAIVTNSYAWPGTGTPAMNTATNVTVAGTAGAMTWKATGTGASVYANTPTGAFSGGTSQNSLLLQANTTSTTTGETLTFTFNSVLYHQGVQTLNFDIFNIDFSAGGWSDKVVVTAYDTKGNVLPASALAAVPLATAIPTNPVEFSTTTSGNSLVLTGTSTDPAQTFNVPQDSAAVTVKGTAGVNIGSIKIDYVSGTSGTSTGIVGIGTISTTYDNATLFASSGLPNKTYNDSQSGISIGTSTAFTNVTTNSVTYSASGLPSGLSINAATGVISGTLSHDASLNAPVTSGSGATLDGTYSVTVTALDSAGNKATTSFSLDSLNQAPVLGTATANQSNVDGASIAPVDASKAFADPNVGDIVTYSAIGLPAGLTINPTTGVISGSVGATDPTGVYAVHVTATDNKGAATTEAFSWAIGNVPPVTVGTLPNKTVNDGQSASIATAAGFSDPLGLPLTYSAAGLPLGLIINAATGVISGTVDHNASTLGPYNVTVSVADGQGGTTSQSFTLTSLNQAPVLGTATANQSNVDGATVSPVDASKAFADPNVGDIVTYSANGLPAGLTINATTGVISGTVAANAAPGSYSVTVIATDNKGAATPETFTWNVADVPPVVAAALPNKTVNDGQSASIVTASGFSDPLGLPLTYSATGLPAGLSINAATGVISGTVDHNASTLGPYNVTVSVSDGQGGTVSAKFIITANGQSSGLVNPPLPSGAIANAPTLTTSTPSTIDVAGTQGIVLQTVNGISRLSSAPSLSASNGIIDSTVNGISILRSSDTARNGSQNGPVAPHLQNSGIQDYGDGAGGRQLYEPMPFIGDSALGSAMFGSSGQEHAAQLYGLETIIRDSVLYVEVKNTPGARDTVKSVTASLANGDPLPNWLQTDPRGMIFGHIPAGSEAITLKVMLALKNGLQVTRTVNVTLTTGQITILKTRDHRVPAAATFTERLKQVGQRAPQHHM